MSNFTDVVAFHKKFEVPVPAELTLMDEKAFSFRSKFLYEELEEFKSAYASNDLILAIDSLLDLVYVACGTLNFLGVHEFEETTQPLQNVTGIPTLLRRAWHHGLYLNMKDTIDEFVRQHNVGNLTLAIEALSSVIRVTKECAAQMTLTQQVWDDTWNAVQTANMTKVRAASAADSKRGSSLDVVKPKGWVAPERTHVEVVNRAILEYAAMSSHQLYRVIVDENQDNEEFDVDSAEVKVLLSFNSSQHPKLISEAVLAVFGAQAAQWHDVPEMFNSFTVIDMGQS